MERLIGKSNPNWTPPNNIKVHISVVLNLGCLIRITWEASTRQSKSSGCIPRILSSCFQGWYPGQQQKIPMCRQDCKPTTALEALLPDKLGSPKDWNARHCRDLMIKVCLPKCTTCKISKKISRSLVRQFNPPNSAFQKLWLARWLMHTISAETWNSAKSNGRVRCSLKRVSRLRTSRNTDLN